MKKTSLGYTLIEMAIVLAIIGILVGTFLKYMNTYQDAKAIRVTQERQQKIANALSDYASSYGRLPCPSVPGMVPEGKSRAACLTVTSRAGTVPYLELGLTEQDATDGYDSLMTYAVSNAAANPSASDVHANCRVDGIWIKSGVALNPTKATFCCQRRPSGDMQVYRDTAPTAFITLQSGSGGDFGSATTAAPVRINNYEMATIAYVLVSHGKNRENAYIQGSGSRPGAISFIGTHETINADDSDNTYYALRMNSMRWGNYFDDIVLWRSQESTISELHNDSCFYP
jgi:prepilin-type N-terminal cleavage/methylation domain-containing protein